MSYVLVGILLLLIVGGFVTFLVMQATKRSAHATATDDADAAPGVGADPSPLGDTLQHAGEQPGDGTTTGGQDADRSGGTGAPTRGADSVTGGGDQDRPDGRFQRDPVGGEAEARPFTETDR